MKFTTCSSEWLGTTTIFRPSSYGFRNDLSRISIFNKLTKDLSNEISRGVINRFFSIALKIPSAILSIIKVIFIMYEAITLWCLHQSSTVLTSLH